MLLRTYTFICRREGRWREGSNNVVIERGQHTRHSRRRGLAQAERLRGSYRYLFLLSSVLIHCCDRNACASTLCAAHSFERNACYNVHICRREGRWREGSNIVVIERGQHTRHSRTRGWPRPSVCVIAIGARFYCPVHSFIVVIEMRALSPAHSLLL